MYTLQILKMAFGFLVFISFVAFLTKVYTKLCESMGIFKLLDKLWKRIAHKSKK